jgi:serine/threonine-protein phosphatase 6 regulatory subunit 3
MLRIKDLFFMFPWNNFLHSVVYDLVHQILNGRVDSSLNRDLIVALFSDAKLMQRIVDGQLLSDSEEYVSTLNDRNINLTFKHRAKTKGVRLGYMGHLTLMSEDVISQIQAYPPDLRVILGPTAPMPEWEEYVNGRYTETKKKDSSLLGGGKPVVGSGVRMGGWGNVDETDSGTASGPSTTGTSIAETEEVKGEFRRASGSRPRRESSADFGPAPMPENEDEDDLEEGSPQVSIVFSELPTCV